MKLKLIFAILPFFAIPIVADESSHSPFDFFSKGVLFRESCKMNPGNSHCQIVGHALGLNYQNGVATRYLKSHKEELWQDYIIKQNNLSARDLALMRGSFERKKEKERSRMLLHRYFIVEKLESEEFDLDFQTSVLELIAASPEFQNQPEQVQGEIRERQKALVLAGLGNAYRDEIQE